MPHEKFNVAHLERLNDPDRFEYLPPEIMWEALGNPSPRTIVDIGAGTGLFACQFAELASDAIVYAVDIEPAAVRWMLEHRPPALCARLRPLLGKRERDSAGDRRSRPRRDDQPASRTRRSRSRAIARHCGSRGSAASCLSSTGRPATRSSARRSTSGPPPSRSPTSLERSASRRHDSSRDCRNHSLVTARKPVICSL